jgi:hypothetical protein
MLKLTYTYKNDKSNTVTLLGDAEGIRDLYWQLTKNYKAADGTEIGAIKVTDLDGFEIEKHLIMIEPHTYSTTLSSIRE